MKTLLRSMFRLDHTDKEELLFRNYLRFQEAGLEFDVPEDVKIWGFVDKFSQSKNHIPEYKTLTAHFTREKDTEVLDRLESFRTIKAITRGDFELLLEDKIHRRRVRQATDLFKEAGSIIQTGIKIKEGKQEIMLKGPRDAIQYVMDRGHDIVRPSFGSRLSGEITADGEDFLAEYERVKNDPLAGVGQFTGIEQLDLALKGARKHELWIHAAFTGGLKSTFMLNWAYNQAVYFHHSNMIISLEMPYYQVRRLLYSMHSYNAKFTDVRCEMGIQPDEDINTGLHYDKIRDGALSEIEERFLREIVVPDYNDPKNEYGKIHIEVADPGKSDFKMSDIQNVSERIYAKSPFSTLYIDHLGLVSSERWVSSTTERLNEVVRNSKRLSMNFNRGQGMATVGLFQIGRRGYEHALKNDGHYNLTHLSYANEAERSADVVTATWTDDDLRKSSLCRFQWLKSRDHEPFEPFRCQVEWSCRRLKTFHEVELDEPDQEAIGEELDGLFE